MKFEKFKSIVLKMIDKANKNGGSITADFKIDTENGRYVALTSDGVKFVGNNRTRKISVLWGSGHLAAI